MGVALLGELPALPLHEAGKYVAGAYIVVFVLVLLYVAIMALRLSRIERDLGELLELSASAPEHAEPADGELSTRQSTLAYPMKGHT
jgi:CcmD family protein